MQQDNLQSIGSVDGVRVTRANAIVQLLASNRLTWWEDVGIGYYPVTAGTTPYNDDYWERYQKQADTDIGHALMRARVDLVGRHHTGEVVDVGIGCGAFIKARNVAPPPGTGRLMYGITYGYDVNPLAVKWLAERGLYRNPNKERTRAICCWDVLEHIPEFDKLIANVHEWAFISLPIFKDAAHVLRSKHFRKDEHVWYFTERGLIWMMGLLGFECIEANNAEVVCGREDIGAFAFRRIDK